MVAVPLVGAARPSSIRSVVVLPAPLGPRKPVTRPGPTSKLRPSTAVTVPYRLVRWSTFSIWAVLSGPGVDARGSVPHQDRLAAGRLESVKSPVGSPVE